MKKIFVVTDNIFIFNQFRKLIDVKDGVSVKYFCSPKSMELFSQEIEKGEITPVVMKESADMLISEFDLGISCHSKQIFPAKLVNTVLCVNIHPGLNPYNRGWFPQVFSIMNGLPAGATIHVMDEEIDHGDIITQEQIEVYSHETSKDVYDRVLEKEIALLRGVLDDIINKSFSGSEPSGEGNYNSIKDYRALCEIDMNKQVTMKEAIDYLRAMTHPPYQNAYFIDEDGSRVFVSVELNRLS